MCGCESAAAARASRSNRCRAVGSPVKSGKRILSATVRSNRVSRALYTSPMPPAPKAAVMAYGPSRVPGVRDIVRVPTTAGEFGVSLTCFVSNTEPCWSCAANSRSTSRRRSSSGHARFRNAARSAAGRGTVWSNRSRRAEGSAINGSRSLMGLVDRMSILSKPSRPARPRDRAEIPAVSDEITKLLEAWKTGNADAGEELVAKTYHELRRIAHAHLRHERRGHTLQTTALLHEAYLRLLRKGPGTVENRDAFFRLMAAEMRRRLVDHARRRLASKRGGGVRHEPLDASVAVASLEDCHEVEAMLGRLDRALDDLNASFPRAARVVELRFIAGLTTEETATAIGLSPGTVKRDWTFARAWLAAALEPDALSK